MRDLFKVVFFSLLQKKTHSLEKVYEVSGYSLEKVYMLSLLGSVLCVLQPVKVAVFQ